MESATKNHIIHFDWTCSIALKSEKNFPPPQNQIPFAQIYIKFSIPELKIFS